MKSILRSSFVQSVLANLIWAYMALIGRTCRWHVEGLEIADRLWEEDAGLIFACWHSRIMLLPVGWTRFLRHSKDREGSLAILISHSPDGEFVARASEKLGLLVIRGSKANKKKTKNKGGAQAIRETGELLGRGGSVCITMDGPRGPRQRAGQGAALLAQKKGAKIIPYVLAASPAIRFKSWDHFVLPMPFAKGVVIFGEPIDAPREVSPKEISAAVELALNTATERAESMIGGRYEPPDEISAL